mgnify:CR=1 FL=1
MNEFYHAFVEKTSAFEKKLFGKKHKFYSSIIGKEANLS